MPKKTKLKTLKQIDGKSEEKVIPSTLDQIWGDTGLSRYHTLNEKEYTTYLSELNKSDLQTHATKIGLLPIDNRELLTSRLLREFKKYVDSFKRPVPMKTKVVSKEALQILAEGR